MGIDANEKIKRPDKFKLNKARVWTPLDVLQGSAYGELSISAKALMLDLNAQLRSKHGEIYNNGDLTTAIGRLSKVGWKSDKTIRKAAKELEAAGLIVKTRQGHLPNKCNLYALTWLPLNENKKLDVDAKGYPLNAYLLKNSVPIIKNSNG